MFRNLPAVSAAVSLSFSGLLPAHAQQDNSKLIAKPSSALAGPRLDGVKNQDLINQVVDFVDLLFPPTDEASRYLIADRIIQSRLNLEIDELAQNRSSPAKRQHIIAIHNLLEGIDPFEKHPTEPIIPYLLFFCGDVKLKPGQLDVVAQTAPIIAQCLGLSPRRKIDPEFEVALCNFQKANSLPVTAAICQETILCLVEQGKLHCTSSPFRLVLSNDSSAQLSSKHAFSLEAGEIIASRGSSLFKQPLECEGQGLIEEVRTALGLGLGNGFDGELEAAIIRFKIKELIEEVPHGDIDSELIKALVKRGLVNLYVVQEDPILYSLRLPEGLSPSTEADLVKIAEALFSNDADRSRNMELALHSSGAYKQVLYDLSDLYCNRGDMQGLRNVAVFLKALATDINLPSRITCPNNGDITSLSQVLELNANLRPEFPSILVTFPESDNNAVFNSTFPVLPRSPQGLNIYYSDVQSSSELGQAITLASCQGLTSIELCISAGHGSEDGVTLGLKEHLAAGTKAAKDFRLSMQFDFAKYKKSFAPEAIWLLQSCLTANDLANPGQSIAFQMSRALPDIYFVAYRESVTRPQAFVEGSFLELVSRMQLLPKNSRYLKLPQDRFLVVTSSSQEIPLVIKDGKIVEDRLKSLHKLSPEKRDVPYLNNTFASFWELLLKQPAK